MKDKDKYGLLNIKAEEILPCRFDWLNYPSNGWIPFRENGQYGFLDMHGKVVIPAQYAYVGGVSKTGALVGTQNNLYGVIDKHGNWLIEPTLKAGNYAPDKNQDQPLEIYGTSTQIPLEKEGKTGVLDINTLTWVVPPQYEWASTDIQLSGHFIAAGDAPYSDKPDKTMGLFSQKGDVLVPRKYQIFRSAHFSVFGYLLASVNQSGEGKHALISPEGKEIIGPEWSSYELAEPGLIIGGYMSDDGPDSVLVHQAYYDRSGKLLIKYTTNACGQEQIVTGDQRVVWPLKLKVCEKENRKR